MLSRRTLPVENRSKPRKKRDEKERKGKKGCKGKRLRWLTLENRATTIGKRKVASTGAERMQKKQTLMRSTYSRGRNSQTKELEIVFH